MTSTLVRGTFGVQKRGTPYEVATPLVEVLKLLEKVLRRSSSEPAQKMYATLCYFLVFRFG